MFQISRRHNLRVACIGCLLLLTIGSSGDIAAQTGNVRFGGVVRDVSGAAVHGARVEFHGQSRVLRTMTSEEGRFSFTDSIGAGTLIITARGFGAFLQEMSAETLSSNVDVVLKPASIREQVTITATRTETPLAATSASVRLLSSSELSTTAAIAIDDALRQVPGFQLFRRSGSRTANPTSQGVSLRGVGASGPSRALVLADGIPFADPFGGWVYWDRLPRVAVDQLEVVRGGISDLYGSNAMGGVINILTRQSVEPTVAFESSYGSQNTSNASVFAGTILKNFTTDLAGEVFRTDGYINVGKADRGSIDIPVASRHRSLYFQVGYKRNEASRLFLRPSYFAERRANGTPVQTNRTHILAIEGGANWSVQRLGELSFRGYLSGQNYDQNFSAISANRNSETLTRVQRVPAQAAGLMLQWARTLGSHMLVGGMEAREVRGASDEMIYDRGNASSLIGAGGRQRSYGLFGRDTLQLSSKLSISGGARFDFFKDFEGLSVSREVSSGARDRTIQFADRTEFSLSPQVSLLYNPNQSLSLFGSFYRAFRMPTLNELYRSFRLGNALTLANENLRREQATGGEAGVRISRDRFDLRVTLFSTSVSDPIANVTIVSSPTLITRQRQNLGRTRSVGLEIDSVMRFGHGWSATAGYLNSDAKVVRFPANPALEGLAVAQTPRQSLTFQVAYAGSRRYRFGLQGRASSAQFDDDQNLLRLRGFFTLDAYISRFVHPKLEVFLAAENLLNSRYEFGRTPIITVAAPALLRIGLKWNYRRERAGQ